VTPNDEPGPNVPLDDDEIAGGDPVCWLYLVCESCGALIERAGDPHRPGCKLEKSSPQP
jgi:hypothetical protein